MPEPCRSCPLDRQEIDFGGCRCQALALVGDASATDPVCHFSPDHAIVVEAREAAQHITTTEALVFRTITKAIPASR
jgi:PqqA peptide cyclase